jgi:hypothetical protein
MLNNELQSSLKEHARL